VERRRVQSSVFTACSVSAVILVAVLPLAGCSGTGAGGTGDPPSEAEGEVRGTGDRVSDLVGPATWLSPEDPNSIQCDSPPDVRARVTGVSIVAVDNFDEANDGSSARNIYVMDVPGKRGPKPYSGLTIFGPSFTPPDLRLFGNEVVDVEGNLEEFLGPTNPFGRCKSLPVLGGTMTFRYDADQVEPLLLVKSAAETLEGENRWEVLSSYERARPYIGMLVRIDDVTFAQPDTPPDPIGRWSAPINVGGGLYATDVPKISNELYDITNTGPAIPEASHFASITGIVTYFYGFKIAPRSPADFVADPPEPQPTGGAQ